MTACLLVIGAFYAKYGAVERGAVELHSTMGQWVVVVLIYVFTANFSWSWAVVSSGSWFSQNFRVFKRC